MPPKAGKLQKTPYGNAERNIQKVCHFNDKNFFISHKQYVIIK